MVSVWQGMLRVFVPADAPPSVQRQYRIIATVVLIFIGVAGVFIPPCLMLGYTGISLGHLAAIISGIAALMALRMFGPALAAHLTAFACCATLIPYITLAGGFPYAFFFWFLIIPLAGGLLGGQRVGLVWSVITAIIVTTYTGLHLLGIALPVVEMQSPPAAMVMSQSIALVFMISATMMTFQQNQRWAEQQTAQAITLLQQEVQERRIAEEKALEANRAKSLFLAMMSHELRTPMNGVLGMAQLLLLEEQSPEHREYTETIQESGTILMELLDGLLDFAKIESGRLVLENRPFELHQAMQSPINLMRGRAVQKGLSLSLELDSKLPTFILGDEIRLRQMVLNLLSNAIKFTRQGEVLLRVTQTPAGLLSISVKDTGIGISSDALDHIFEPFHQADSTITRQFGGTGLGLSIVASLAEMMGGTITADSIEDSGSTFTIVIPLQEEQSQPPQKAAALPSRSHLHVLLVEDNTINQLVASRLLDSLGCKTTVAGNGLEALEKLKTTPFDLVLMDIQMPVMDGLEATKRIRAQQHLSLPVVGLTASAMHADRQACLHVGMQDVLLKPLQRTALSTILQGIEAGD